MRQHADGEEVLPLAGVLARMLPQLTRRLFAGEDAVAARLPLAQLKVCGILADGPKSMTDLGQELGVSRSAMTQIADRLERTKLVKRGSVGTDRRVRCLKLTGLGQKFMRKRQATLVHRLAAVLEQLPPDIRQQTFQTLAALLNACLAVDRNASASKQAVCASPLPRAGQAAADPPAYDDACLQAATIREMISIADGRAL